MRRILSLLLLLVLLPLTTVVSANATKERPKIGLVLGGGGAAGIAHVGVLKVLEELNVPIDMIAGTSMGAIVGSLYAAGYSADELEAIVNKLDWEQLLHDSQPRQELTFQQKSDNSSFFNAIELGVKGKSVQLPEGLLDGQRLNLELRRLLGRVAHISNFDQLPIPFRAVATNIETGKAVELKHGNLPTSVRASMSIPGLFSPVKIGNQLLVDGFVSNNVPVDVAKKMGADIVIVAYIPFFFKKQSGLKSAIDISVQSMEFLTAKNSLPQLKGITAPNVLIAPNTKGIGSLSFDKIKSIVPLGKTAALKKRNQLERLARLVKTDKKPVSRKIKHIDAKTITRIILQNSSPLSDELILNKFGIKQGDRLNLDELQKGLSRIYSLGYFDTVDYRLDDRNQKGYTLKVLTQKRTTGNNRIKFGLSLEDDFDGDSKYQIGAQLLKRGMNSLGGEWRNSAIIGERLKFESQWYQPLTTHEESSFVDSKIWYNKEDLYAYEDGSRVAEVEVAEQGFQIDWGQDIKRSGEFRVGLYYRNLEPSTIAGSIDLTTDNLELAGGMIKYEYDTLDDAYLPSTGKRVTLQYTNGMTNLGSDVDFNRVNMGIINAWKRGKHRWINNTELGTTFNNDTFLTEQLTLGGFGRLSGLSENQIRGNHSILTSNFYLYELGKVGNLATMFAGASYELGNVWEKKEDIELDSALNSGSLFLGVRTDFGPLYVGVGQTEGHGSEAFMTLGGRF